MESSMNLEPLRWQMLTLPASKDQLAAGQESKNVHRSVKQSQVGGFALVFLCWQKFFPQIQRDVVVFFVLRSLNKNGQKDGSGTKRKRKLTCISGSGHWHTLNRSTPLSQPKHLPTPSKVGPELGTDGNWLNQRFEPLQLAFKKQVFGQLAVIQRFQVER